MSLPHTYCSTDAMDVDYTPGDGDGDVEGGDDGRGQSVVSTKSGRSRKHVSGPSNLIQSEDLKIELFLNHDALCSPFLRWTPLQLCLQELANNVGNAVEHDRRYHIYIFVYGIMHTFKFVRTPYAWDFKTYQNINFCATLNPLNNKKIF
jgi:hypothetical protein